MGLFRSTSEFQLKGMVSLGVWVYKGDPFIGCMYGFCFHTTYILNAQSKDLRRCVSTKNSIE